MGDRVSISFKNGNDESVALFHHWGGLEFVDLAEEYVAQLPRGEVSMPLDRREPGTVMVDFIRHITQNMDRVKSSLYLGKDPEDGDNSDNGHFVIDVNQTQAMPTN